MKLFKLSYIVPMIMVVGALHLLPHHSVVPCPDGQVCDEDPDAGSEGDPEVETSN